MVVSRSFVCACRFRVLALRVRVARFFQAIAALVMRMLAWMGLVPPAQTYSV